MYHTTICYTGPSPRACCTLLWPVSMVLAGSLLEEFGMGTSSF